MKDTMYVKPAGGLIVRDPVTKEALPEAGREVPRNQYWNRCLRSGDVLPAKPAKPEKSTPSPSKG